MWLILNMVIVWCGVWGSRLLYGGLLVLLILIWFGMWMFGCGGLLMDLWCIVWSLLCICLIWSE